MTINRHLQGLFHPEFEKCDRIRGMAGSCEGCKQEANACPIKNGGLRWALTNDRDLVLAGTFGQLSTRVHFWVFFAEHRWECCVTTPRTKMLLASVPQIEDLI
jgi:hypothetical protein